MSGAADTLALVVSKCGRWCSSIVYTSNAYNIPDSIRLGVHPYPVGRRREGQVGHRNGDQTCVVKGILENTPAFFINDHPG